MYLPEHELIKYSTRPFFLVLLIFLSTVFSVFHPAVVFAYSNKNSFTAVIGFVNAGSGDKDMNVLLTRSFISFLSRIPGAKIIPFEVSDRLSREKGYFNRNEIDQDLAIQIGQQLDCKQVLTGLYQVDKKNMTVRIDVYYYDTVTGDTIFKRQYEGMAGTGLLDTIDRVRKNSAGLIMGRDVPMGKLTVAVTNTRNTYEVLLGGYPDGFANPVYQRNIPAGAPFDVTLRCSNTGMEVFRSNVTLVRDKDTTLKYYPSASVFIQTGIFPADIYINGRKTGYTVSGESHILNGLPSATNYLFSLKNDSLQSVTREVRLTEGKPTAVLFEKNDFYRRYRYADTNPYWDLLLPGLVQCQAGDYGASLLWGGLWLADIGAFAYCVYMSCIADYIVNNSPNPVHREEVRPIRDLFIALSAAGGAGWIGLALGSWFHAGGMRDAEVKEKNSGFSVGLTPRSGFRLEFYCYYD